MRKTRAFVSDIALFRGVRPLVGTSARRPRNDTGGAAALVPRALGTPGAPEPLQHQEPRQPTTSGVLQRSPSGSDGGLGNRSGYGGCSDKKKLEVLDDVMKLLVAQTSKLHNSLLVSAIVPRGSMGKLRDL